MKSDQSIGRKGLALYRHKWHEDDKKPGESSDGKNDSRANTADAKSSSAFGWNDDAELGVAPDASSVFNRKHQTIETGT